MSESYADSLKSLGKIALSLSLGIVWVASGAIFILIIADGGGFPFGLRTVAGRLGWLLTGALQIPLILAMIFFLYHDRNDNSERAKKHLKTALKISFALLIPYWICIIFL